MYNLNESVILQNSHSPFRFVFRDFRLRSRYNVNYGARYVYKHLYGSSVAICLLNVPVICHEEKKCFLMFSKR